ncbi:MAG: NAD(P)/FAD-dependent oxidoreductase [Desulfurococcaceae archaeon]
MKEFDVVIVGAGAAGLFAAVELVKQGVQGRRIAIFEKGAHIEARRCPMANRYTNRTHGQECRNCSPCHVVYGVGGAGTFSSGIVNLRPDVGGELDKLLGSWEDAENVISYLDKLLVEFGAPENTLIVPDPKKTKSIEKLAAKAGAKYIPVPQRVLGTENVIKVVENITRFLENAGVSIFTLTPVERVEKSQEGLFKLTTTRGDYYARRVLLAPGRGGAHWFRQVAEALGIEVEPTPLDIGVRVEVPYYVAEHVTSVNFDPKIILYTKSYDDMVRTFCTNPQGYVLKEQYEDGTVGVNGATFNTAKSKNTNFALLVTLKLTVPYQDVLELGKSIARIATKVGMGKPLIQRLGDLEKGRRSTWERISRSIITPTLRDVTPGDISLVLPHRVVANIVEAIERLDTVYPGLASPQTLIYAPEIKYYSVRAKVNIDFETSVPGVYAAGDGAGLSRGINGAAATGILAARGIAKSL